MIFHFDYLSPYAYLAWWRVRDLCRERELELTPVPTLLAGLLGRWGHLGPAEIPPKREYVFRDCLRQARWAGVPFHPPAHHPFRPLTALRVSLPEVCGDDQLGVIDALWRAGWGEGRELGEDDSVIAILDDAGFDGAALVARTREPDVKASLKRATEDAIEAGVFGVPTMIAGGQLFWGNDRVSDLLRVLDEGDPVEQADLDAILARHEGVGASRGSGRSP